MGDLIERKTAIEAIKNYKKAAIDAGKKTLNTVDDIVEIARMMDMLPAVDTAPVVHGKWKSKNQNMYGAVSGLCSICGMYAGLWLRNTPYKYCPYCGAKMDLEDE